ncbi:hypothetical protein NP233_g1444 [Leucocoprinus birnbaumii]|uniref:Uncharacterized protein n=1 Tax=Leucocoprinus birnbaumii TaxID=56174 RepID=A0AAD5YVU5_9AGAR|nr:hypothetical protein NP233_g1444 [Leucocoprinus birnbaumii]
MVRSELVVKETLSFTELARYPPLLYHIFVGHENGKFPSPRPGNSTPRASAPFGQLLSRLTLIQAGEPTLDHWLSSPKVGAKSQVSFLYLNTLHSTPDSKYSATYTIGKIEPLPQGALEPQLDSRTGLTQTYVPYSEGPHRPSYPLEAITFPSTPRLQARELVFEAGVTTSPGISEEEGSRNGPIQGLRLSIGSGAGRDEPNDDNLLSPLPLFLRSLLDGGQDVSAVNATFEHNGPPLLFTSSLRIVVTTDELRQGDGSQLLDRIRNEIRNSASFEALRQILPEGSVIAVWFWASSPN